LIFTPNGRDASVARALLEEGSIPSVICADIIELENRLDDEASFAIVAEEGLQFADLRRIGRRLEAQPAWSDLPFVILSRRSAGAELNSDARALSELVGNATFLERPFHPATLISVARMALKSRQRQFEARARLEELHEGEERLRTALLAGRLGTWELDLTTWVLRASAEFKALFSPVADEPFSYEDLVRNIHPEDREHMREMVRLALETGSDLADEFRNLGPNGNVHWVEIRARMVRDRASQNPRLIGVSSDITDRKTGEETLRRLNEILEERVASRTAELKAAHTAVLTEIEQRRRAEEQLRQAQKMEMIGQLTGGVAHDFNNLLMAVLGNLDLLRKLVPDDPKVARLIDGALEGARRGASLTQRLLAFARQQDLKVEPRDLADLIGGAADLIERSAGGQVELHLDLPTRLAPALVDANQVELAVLNLVVNARDAMPDGGVLSISVDQVEIAAEDELAAGSYLRVIVSDTGIGMDTHTLQKATEPFFSTKELGKGTGLGLSMVQGLAVQLHGGLRLNSQLGRGTTVELWLPATTFSAEPAETTVSKANPEAVGKMTILVVDDDTLIAMSTVDMLEDLGHHAIEANSGDRALDILRDDRTIDLLITDYSMPRMNGAQLAVAAREIRPELPILLATGYAEVPAGSGVGLPRIGKPYQQRQLASEIARVLKQDARGIVTR
jgi:PAS domain S-box-containing protein